MKRGIRSALKFVLAVLAAVMLLAAPCSASAKTVASIGKKNYSSLEKAVDAVKNGQTIKLRANVNEMPGLFTKAKYTIDLNGKTVKNEVSVYYGNVTIKNGTLKADSDNVCGRITVLDKNTKLTLENVTCGYGSKKEGNVPFIFYMFEGGKMEIKSGKYYLEGGNVDGKNSKLTVSGGTLAGDENIFSSIDIENNGAVSIQGGKVKDITIGCGKGTTLTVKGGTIVARSNGKDIANKVGGTAIAISKSVKKVSITGGKIIDKSKKYPAVSLEKGKSSKVKINTKYISAKSGKKIAYNMDYLYFKYLD